MRGVGVKHPIVSNQKCVEQHMNPLSGSHSWARKLSGIWQGVCWERWMLHLFSFFSRSCQFSLYLYTVQSDHIIPYLTLTWPRSPWILVLLQGSFHLCLRLCLGFSDCELFVGEFFFRFFDLMLPYCSPKVLESILLWWPSSCWHELRWKHHMWSTCFFLEPLAFFSIGFPTISLWQLCVFCGI